ncbi:hypothetical protein BZG35_08380 [Brevundimonas sp. LM2]|uniref:FecR family protein n=1 Tax=Brevundimonas sp. LM2 TaxID=1938605 RepID=UPI000983A061|nr:FecR domain-containing protein [Brevundimonas sp. LM2]AQR61665.1 hypothetical protein BZG35_08380 [Brevundimonas sp. LM2]
MPDPAPVLQSTPDAGHDPTPDHYEAAVAWLVRLREPDTPALTAAFQAWLAADPAHAFAFAEMEALFDAVATPTRAAAERDRRAQGRSAFRPHYPRSWARPLLRRPLAVAAGLAAAVLLVTGQSDRLATIGAEGVTAPGEIETLTLADGSRVTLNTRSIIQAEVDRAGRAVRLERGEAFFDIASDPARPFYVHAGDARIRVVGTRFNVRRDRDRVVVTVDHGVVAVAPTSNLDNPATVVVGRQAVVQDQAVTAEPAPLDGQATAWRRGQLVFNQTPLREVVAELNRYRAGRILVLNADLADQTVSGAFNTANVDGAVRGIERTLGTRAARLPGVTVIY